MITNLGFSFIQSHGNSSDLKSFMAPAQIKVAAKSTCNVQRTMLNALDGFVQ